MDNPGEQRSEGQRDEHEPGSRLHHDIDATPRLSILAGQAEDGESEENNDSAEPTDRGSDMRRERELANAGWHGHGRYRPFAGVVEGVAAPDRVWRPGPWPPGLNSRMTNDRNTMKARIPNTVTQRGAPGYRGRSAMEQLYRYILSVSIRFVSTSS